MTEEEEVQFFTPIRTLSRFRTQEGGVDSRVWRPSKDGVFSVSSFLSVLQKPLLLALYPRYER